MKRPLRSLLFALAAASAGSPGHAQLLAAIGQRQHPLLAQQSTRSLKSVLQDFKTHYKVDILYFDSVVQGYEVPVSALDFQVNAEKSLSRILKPLGLQYRRSKTGGYIVVKPLKDGKKSQPTPVSNAAGQPLRQFSFTASSEGQTAGMAAEIVLNGKVSDDKGAGLPGVSVVVKGTQRGTITDERGEFSVEVADKDAILVFSFVGFLSQELTVGNKTRIEVMLASDVKSLEELVVTGYSSQKKSLMTGSVASVNVTEEMQNMPTTSAGNLLAGRLAGVNIKTPNGIPGTNPEISIRTGSSLNAQPVTYVIDGVIRGSGDFNNLSPNEIETITVLKDAASAAVYGSRSAGGVILITTRRGKAGKPSFNYSFNTGFDTRTKNVALTSAVQAGELYNRINGAADPAGWAWSQEELDHYKSINNGWGYDQLESVWRNPSTSQHNLSVSGGSEKVRYFAGASYVKQNGFLKPLTYDKYNIRLNATIDATKDLQFFVGMGLSNNLQGNVTWEGPQSLYRKLLVWQPDQPVYTDSGKLLDYGWIANVGGTVAGDGGYDKVNFLKPQIVLNATYQIPVIKGLSAKAAYSKNYAYNRQKIFQKSYLMHVMKRDGANKHIVHTDDASIIGTKASTNIPKDYLRTNVDWGQDYQLDLQLNYENTFNNIHHVQGLLVYEKAESSGSGIFAGRETFPVYTTDQWWAASGTRADDYAGGNTDFVSGRASYIGQFNYDYDGKYLATFSFRQDGSMNFAPDKRWGFFPAGAVGWVISKESFFKTRAIDNLKLRLSAGLTGNDAVGGLNGSAVLSGWQWQESYKQGTSAYFGTDGKQATGITYGSVVNPNLTWEKALTYNAGADITFLKNWTATLEYWNRKSYDILGMRTQSVPPTFSLTLPPENYGVIKAKGFDVSIGYEGKKNAFTYFGGLTASYGWNKVVTQDYAQNAQQIDIPTGRSLTVIKGLQFDKIIRTQSELDQFNSEHPGYKYNGFAPELGMMTYKDLSGPQGTPDGIIDTYDRVVIKANNFPIVYGLNLGGSWKGFSVDLLFNGNLKQKKSYQDLAGGVEWNRMYSGWYDNSWTPGTPDAALPKRVSANQSNTYNTESSFWYQNAGFARLKYLNVSYTVPTRLYNKALESVKVYFSGTNLFNLTGFSYYDPEIGDGTAYPVMRSFNFGINVTF
ncbi:TonB-linked outer membrane protein, SusC/RagA family [Dyadobacter sp. SG02]|uniref:SusC/RagA family TonB-linked outer membrane protein n=1 Tax=Dyadobacter sp. SG02 TaxID=1855291 RepID=UPI0008C55862|nr:TonB-dependent receptor [Dyadobacter sp. SG02]SEJ85305.1 TonB-linked outer membrane protein, SusC/RagA family [Dyadobacter sp. SG02]